MTQAALDQAVADASSQLSTDLDSLDSDVKDLPGAAFFSDTLKSYATDWALMQKDYQTEYSDYQQGCGPYNSNAIQVQSDAITVHSDLISINSDDISMNGDVMSFNTADISRVQADMQTVQSDWATLEAAVAADASGSVSAQFTWGDVNTAASKAAKQVDTSNKALSAAQASVKQYDTEAKQKDTDAQNLVNSMHC